ncbi:pyrroline-5-carboxylate reductase [Clostridium acetireducens DSM 10703]|jgi:pyrroline-5-carboxylate reductase|uniref:Pyrroline-5-carboxylate reductase n=1 Tax=Clostridium acetireducens DSM 10703 TaxID=1121290 RepID=A0A1E8F1F8_9CLOT|nr:pyrroline-5-carboxylate reductase [Clostridium acetireducens]OFI07422.1 pyrroline-5-carboxylate reductase [Clostridium acetireducens DSM 10703]
MEKNIGIIGCGNMGQAILGGIINSNMVMPHNVMISNRGKDKLNYIKNKYNINICDSNTQIPNFSDIIILAIKPNICNDVIEEIKDLIKKDTIIISIVAGISLEQLSNKFNKGVKIIRVMPNTPALVGEAMSALSYNEFVNDNDVELAKKIFESFGKVEIIDEKLMDAVTAISGSSPAYVYMFIEALADGGVLLGLSRDKAYKMAAQAVLGSAKMVLETKEHPGKLKDNVCSPSGTTIEAVYTLEKNNFRGSIISAVKQCGEKSQNMGKNN